ncbi:MAG: DUF4116 domain-containing protein, partial [Candidatus Margulisbacteria bacterium]|nr:DUF4116 domain-containing protein [Candidatus Margulisiibacteriota bacterium]
MSIITGINFNNSAWKALKTLVSLLPTGCSSNEETNEDYVEIRSDKECVAKIVPPKYNFQSFPELQVQIVPQKTTAKELDAKLSSLDIYSVDKEQLKEIAAQNGNSTFEESEYKELDSYLKMAILKSVEYASMLVEKDGRNLKYLDDSFKKDKIIVRKAVLEDPSALQYTDESLRKDRQFVLQLARIKGLCLCYADEDLQDDPEVVRVAIAQNGEALACASKRLKNDTGTVLLAVQEDGLALKYASDRLKKDAEMVGNAVYQNGLALEFASDDL